MASAGQQPLCAQCEKKAADKFCTDCNSDYCTPCSGVIHAKALSGHNVVAVVDKLLHQPSPHCSTHDEPRKLYCMTDGELCCTMCAQFGDHKGHAVKMVKDAANEARAQLKRATLALLSFRNVLNELVNHANALEKGIGSTLAQSDFGVLQGMDVVHSKLLSLQQRAKKDLPDALKAVGAGTADWPDIAVPVAIVAPRTQQQAPKQAQPAAQPSKPASQPAPAAASASPVVPVAAASPQEAEPEEETYEDAAPAEADVEDGKLRVQLCGESDMFTESIEAPSGLTAWQLKLKVASLQWKKPKDFQSRSITSPEDLGPVCDGDGKEMSGESSLDGVKQPVWIAYYYHSAPHWEKDGTSQWTCCDDPNLGSRGCHLSAFEGVRVIVEKKVELPDVPSVKPKPKPQVAKAAPSDKPVQTGAPQPPIIGIVEMHRQGIARKDSKKAATKKK